MHVAAGVADQYAARIGDHAAAARRREHGEKLRGFRGAARERARTEAHAERAPGFGEGDVKPQNAGFVFALERDEMAAASSTATVSGARLLSRAFFSATSTMVEACASVTADMMAPM